MTLFGLEREFRDATRRRRVAGFTLAEKK